MEFVRQVQSENSSLNTTHTLNRRRSIIHLVAVRDDGKLRFPFIFVTKLTHGFGALSLGGPCLLSGRFKFTTGCMGTRGEVSCPSLPRVTFGQGGGVRVLTRRVQILCITLAETGRGLFLMSSIGDTSGGLGR